MNFFRENNFVVKKLSKIFFHQKSSKTAQLQNDSNKPYSASWSYKMAHLKCYCLQLNLKIEKMQVHAFERFKSCSILAYTNTSWYRPFSHQKHYVNDKRVDSGDMSCGKDHFFVQIKQLTKNVRKSHFTFSGEQIRLLWAVLKLSSFWTFLVKKHFSIDFLKIFSRKARKSRNCFHEKNSSSQIKVIRII